VEKRNERLVFFDYYHIHSMILRWRANCMVTYYFLFVMNERRKNMKKLPYYMKMTIDYWKLPQCMNI